MIATTTIENQNMKNTIYKLTALIAVLAVSLGLNAQEVIMEQDVNKDTVVSTFGKNKQRYFGSNFGLGVPIENSTGNESLKRTATYMFHYGVYYKIKASNFYSVVGQASYQKQIYSFEVSSPDVFYEELALNNASLALLNRFNFGKRGNFIGYYLALGASVDYNFRNKMRTKTEALPENDFEYYKVSAFKLDYINRLNYNAEVQVGINKLVLFGKYRLSDVIDSKKGYNLPPTTVGVLFDFGA